MIRVKICGITSAADARMVAATGADAIGLVFCESPRQVTIDQARFIIKALPPFTAAVGLFVNEKPADVIRIAQQLGLGIVQLHGDESPEEVAAVARSCRVIKAIRVRDEADVERALDYEASAAACLFDAYVPGVPGGTGQTFNWDLLPPLKSLPLTKPWILAGGLNEENIDHALRGRQPYGVDVSSGVEREPGIKDPDKVSEFVLKARQ